MSKIIVMLLTILVLFANTLAQKQDDGARDIFLGSRREKTGPASNQSADMGSQTNSTARKRVDSFGSGPKRRKQGATMEKKTMSPTSVIVASAPTTMGLGYTLFLKNNDTKAFFRVSPNRIFNTGQSLRLLIEANMDGYLYLFHQENNGPVRLLYPASEVRDGDNRIWAHYPQFVPDPNLYEFSLTGGPAVEIFSVVVSREPLRGVPIGAGLRGLKAVPIDSILFREITRAVTYREYHSTDDSDMTDRERSRDVAMVKSDPPPSHILLNRYSAGERVVARFDIEHR